MPKYPILLLLIIFCLKNSMAQKPQVNKGGDGIVHGNIISEGQVLPFATVSLYKNSDSSLVTGIITDEKGRFELTDLPVGKYYLNVSFIGFKTGTFNNIEISASNSIVKIQNFEIKPDIQSLNEVEITSNLPAIDYQIDKKVVNVDKQITATSGSAVDVLQNVPSVQVSATGDVTLRGSSGFMVFIDGRPSVLSGSEALNQIPASSIDKIELITNPSAKYDPDGTSGIINIITKKNSLEGFSGVVNGNIGWDDKYGADFLLYFRKKSINYFLSADYNHRYFPGIESLSRYTAADDTIYLTEAEGFSDRISTRYQIRGGIETNLSVHDFLSVSATAGFREYRGPSELNYRETTLPYTGIDSYLSRNVSQRSGNFYSISSDYEHKFKNAEHKLNAQVVYNTRISYERNDNELVLPGGELQSGQQSTEDGPSSEFRAKVDYTLPLKEKMRFESGAQLRTEVSNDTNKVYNLNSLLNEYEFQALYSNSIKYNEDIYALYGIFRDERNKLGYQIGVRTEYTGRFVNNLETDSSASIDRWDFFPSGHFSYKLPKDNQLMFSYSRRIERPRGYYFEPFITWVDAFNVRQGNPSILPEYINSFEIGWTKTHKKTLFSFEAYYRQVENKIERFRSVYSDNIILTTFQNVGTDHSLGTEGMVSTDLKKWWNMDIMGNVYFFRGDYTNQNLNNESTNWNSRLNNTFYIGKEMQFQINGMYQSATISAQGRVEDFYMISAAVKRTFYEKKLSLTLQANDIFQSARRQSTSQGIDFKTEDYSRQLAPIVMLNVSYRLNNYKAKKPVRGDMDGGDEF